MTTVTHSHAELVRTFIDQFWNAAQPDSLNLLAPDYIDHAYHPATSEGLQAVHAELSTAFPDHQTSIEAMVVQDDLVMARMTLRATHVGSFRGIAPTGREIHVQVYRSYRIVDGRIAEHWALLDTLSLLRQIGALPSPA